MSIPTSAWKSKFIRPLVYFIVIAATSFLSITAYRIDQEEASSDEGLIVMKVASAILGQEREVIIHLPHDFDSTKAYPIAYVLDGSSLDGPVANSFEVLADAGAVSQAIVVGIPNMSAQNRQFNLVPPFMRTDNDRPDSPVGNGDKFLSFMETELFPFIEKKYVSSHQRLFFGHSRAGLLVMYSLMYKPDMFEARFCFSTPVWRQDQVLVSKVSELFDSHERLKTFVYLSVGDRETDNMKSGFEGMLKVLRERSPKGLTWRANYTANADHQNNARISVSKGIAEWGSSSKH